MKQTKKEPTYLNLWKSNQLKSLLGLFVGISIVGVIAWVKFLPVYIFSPVLVVYFSFIFWSIKLIFHIDSRLKSDKDYYKIIENENKTVRKYVFYFVYIIIGSILLLRALDSPIFKFEFQMKIFSITTIVATLTYLIFLWMYYKSVSQKK